MLSKNPFRRAALSRQSPRLWLLQFVLEPVAQRPRAAGSGSDSGEIHPRRVPRPMSTASRRTLLTGPAASHLQAQWPALQEEGRRSLHPLSRTRRTFLPRRTEGPTSLRLHPREQLSSRVGSTTRLANREIVANRRRWIHTPALGQRHFGAAREIYSAATALTISATFESALASPVASWPS
jgi:hypothetical protein